MEAIVAWSIRNRVLVVLAFFALTVTGIWSVRTTSLDAIPDLSENQVIVFTEFMGRSPEIVESQVTFPLSTALQGLSGVKAVRATSMFGMSFIFVIFEDDVEQYWARTRVLEKLSSIQAALPLGVKTTLGPDGTGIGHVFWYTIESPDYDLAELRSIQDWYIKPQLQSLPGVAEVASMGGFIKQYQITLDPNRLRAYNISPEEIRTAIQRANNDVGGKIVEVSDREHFIRGQGYLKDETDIRSLVLRSPSGIPVRIGDVANVQVGSDVRRGAIDKNGEGETTGGIIVMRLGENAKAVIDEVKAKIPEIERGLPKGVKLVTAYDRSDLILASIDTLVETLWQEALIVALIILLFLFHLPSAWRVIVTLPISVLIAFIFMRMFDITSNIMSLGGIAIGIGVIVDAAIVMLEGANRSLAEAEDRKARTGETYDYHQIVTASAQRVIRGIFFSVLIIIISFLPILLLTGQEGKLFRPLAYTKTFALLGSIIVSVFLIPALMGFRMKGRFRTEAQNPVSRALTRTYSPVFKWLMRHRKLVLITNIVIAGLTVGIATRIGSEFMPALDEGSILFMPTMLPNVSMGEATRIVQVQDKIIADYPEVVSVLGKVGRAETATDNAPISMIESIIILKPREEWREGITKEQIVKDLDRLVKIPGVAPAWTQPIVNRINMLSTGVRTDIGVKIFGQELDTVEKLVLHAEAILKSIPGAVDVVAERSKGGSYLDVRLKNGVAERYGITSADLNSLVEGVIGGENVSTMISGRARYPINVRYQMSFRDNVSSLAALPILLSSGSASSSSTAMNGMDQSSAVARVASPSMSSGSGMAGMSAELASAQFEASSSQKTTTNALAPQSPSQSYVRLGDIADITVREGAPMIGSENALLRSLVSLNVRDRDMVGFVEEAKRVLASKLQLPAGYTLSWSGQFEHQQRAKERLLIVVPIVLIVILLLLYLALKDIKEASLIMLCVPMAMIGGVVMMYMMDYNWSVAIWAGMIAIFGTAVETGVVMMIYLHESLDSSLKRLGSQFTQTDLEHAVREASTLRLRPILMTVLTDLIGLLPILWATGIGSDIMRPLSAPVIGGMFTTLVQVLVVMPILFYMLKMRQLRKGQLKLGSIAQWA